MLRFFSLTSVLLICLASFLTAKEATPLTDSSLWKQPVIIGASLSNGYHHQERIGGPKSDALALDHYLKKHLPKQDTQITNLSNRLSFISPVFISHNQLYDASKLSPSVIIAVDQLFWHLYGRYPNTKTRLKTFQNALDKLDQIDCPLVVGNIPDASKAVRLMLSASQVPKLETINKANEILTEWVKKRLQHNKQTAIVDLSHFMKICLADEEIKLNNIVYPAGSTKAFLQRDMLHPTPLGVTAISHAVMDALHTIQVKEEAKP